MKNLITLSIILVSLSISVTAKDYDVHGRDMSQAERSILSSVNWLGHLGMEKNKKIYNMLSTKSPNKTVTGLDNFLHVTDIKKFKNEGDNYWGTKYEDPLPTDSNIGYFLSIVRLAGAVYTSTAIFNKNPQKLYDERTNDFTYIRGVLRCDGLVRNALVYGRHKKSPILYPKYVFNKIKNTREN